MRRIETRSYHNRNHQPQLTISMGKTSLLEALSEVGLANPSDVTEQTLREKEQLRLNQQKLMPKTIEELKAAGVVYDFFSRVRLLVGFIEGEPSEAMIVKVQNFVKVYMFGGTAGKEFHQQLHELKSGAIDLPTLKAKWPKIFIK